MKDNEVYLALIGGRIGKFWWGRGHWPAEGQPASVDFDYNLVMKREEEYGDLVGFYHTHPHFPASPSSTDYATMGAWTVCFGKKLVCVIDGIDGMYAHWFEDDETEHKTGWVKRFGNLFIGMDP